MPLFYNIEWYGFIKDGTHKYFYLRDSLQNIIAIIDSTGNLVVRYNYTAYGLCTITYNSEGIAQINPFRYKGYYYDNESGMYYCNSRYYVPEWCRWLTPDGPNFLMPDTLNGMNLFAYCGNDPVNRYDPSGRAFASILAGFSVSALIGGAIGAASYTVGQLLDYAFTKDFEWSWGGFIGSTVGGAVGGMISFALPFVGVHSVAVGAFFSGASTMAGTMIGENIGGDADYSSKEIFIGSASAGIISTVSCGAMKRIRLPKVNAGRGSFSAISSQIYTKFRNQTISRITAKTFGKMLVSSAYEGIAGDIIDTILEYTGLDELIKSWF